MVALSLFSHTALADAVVFLYHRFGEDRYPSTNVRIGQFEAHLAYLAENDYQVWPLERIVEHLDQGRAIPDKTVAITVDDAYLSVYEEAYPRLRGYGWPFTVFVSTEPVDRKLKGYMSWDQMREMARDGARYGNHGVTHRHLLRRLPDEDEAAWRARMRWEVDTAQRRLAEELQVEEKIFAYPYGEFDRTLAELVADAGYVGFGQQSGPVSRYADRRALPRFPMAEAYAEISEFRLKARTLAMPVAAVEPWEPVLEGTAPPRLEIRLAETLDRAGEVRCFVTGQGLAQSAWVNEQRTRLVVQAKSPLPRGRSRYNCSVPARDGRYYWYSHPWVVAEG